MCNLLPLRVHTYAQNFSVTALSQTELLPGVCDTKPGYSPNPVTNARVTASTYLSAALNAALSVPWVTLLPEEMRIPPTVRGPVLVSQGLRRMIDTLRRTAAAFCLGLGAMPRR